jgi:putative transposase
MVNMVQKKIVNHFSEKELDDLIKKYKKDPILYRRLVLIAMVQRGKKVSEACEILKISEPTGHRWVDNYNEKGLDGLINNYSNHGRPSKLTDVQLDEFKRIIENEDYLTVQRAKEIIKNRYNVDYTDSGVRKLLKRLDYNHGKPHPKFYKQHKNAEEELKKNYLE